jgi:HlyD family secretion protein
MTETPASTARHSLDRSATEYDPAVARRLRFNPRAVIAGTVFATIIGLAIGIWRASSRCLFRARWKAPASTSQPGSLAASSRFPVSRGQDVAAGTTLLVIDNPELVVQLHEAEAGKLVADAELARINVGTRSEIIAQRKAEIDRAAADLTLAQQTYNRTKQLAAPQSKLDHDTSLVDLSDSWLGFSLRCDRGAG